MGIYVLHVVTGKEEIISRSIDREEWGFALYFPKRPLMERKMGRLHKKMQPIFPGYLFLEADSLDDQIKTNIIKMPGVFRFLPENTHIQELNPDDSRFFRQLISTGKTGKDISLVEFDENDRIKVIEGPLKGREGQIVKVDRRKKRVRVQLTLFKEASFVDFSVRYIGKR